MEAIASFCGSNVLKWADCSEKRISNVETKNIFRDCRSRGRSENVRMRRIQRDDLDDDFAFTLRTRSKAAEKHSSISRCSAAEVAERTLTMNTVRICERVKVRLKLDHQIQFGEHHAAVDLNETSGAWKERVMMDWSEAGWVVDLEATPGERIEFKYIMLKGNDNVVWEDGPNRIFIAPDDCCKHFQINSHWSKINEKLDLEVLRQYADTECRAFPSEGERVPSEDCSETSFPREESGTRISVKAQQEASSGRASEWWSEGGSNLDANSFRQPGKSPSTKPKKRSSDRMGNLDINDLDRPAKYIVQGDRKSPSWWLKLDLVRNLLTGDLGKTERLESLVSSATYLTSGKIPCSKGDGAQPTKNLGEISRYIFRELERIVSGKLVTQKEVIMVRKMHRLIPTFRRELTKLESLERIQALVKHNDVPNDVKADLDFFVNSQVCSASGPENLAKAKGLQAKIKNLTGNFNSDLLNRIDVFCADLREFYNTNSLQEKLEALLQSFDEQRKGVLEQFLDSKQIFEASIEERSENSVEGSERLVEALHDLTGLRAVLAKGLESGLRNDAPDEAIAMRQKWRLADAGLEDYASLLISRYATALKSNGGAKLFSNEAKAANFSLWNQPLWALVLGIRQAGLSGWDQRECLAIENELLAWEAAGIFPCEGLQKDTKMWAQRLEATLERAHRLSRAYFSTMRELYSTQAEKQGGALGVSKKFVRSSFNAELQSSVISTVSSILSILLTAARDLSGSGGWDIILPGEATGMLVEADRLVSGVISEKITTNSPVILVVKEANGDEEVGDPHVTGLILQQQLPHSSHLGMTARQKGVVFATLTDDEGIGNWRSMIGKQVRIRAAGGEAKVSLLDETADSERRLPNTERTGQSTRDLYRSTASAVPSARGQLGGLEENGPQVNVVLDLERATSVRDAGLKATICRKLLLLTNELENGRLVGDEDNAGAPAAFKVPKSQIIPTGAFEAALTTAGVTEEYVALLKKSENTETADELGQVCEQLCGLVSCLRPEKAVMESIILGFGPGARLILRLNTNTGSLSGNPAQRLSKQVMHLSTSDLDAFGEAIAEIWASLYTPQQMLRRRESEGPPGGNLMMVAVLVQEVLVPDLSFVLCTSSPVDREVMHAEIASGHGKVLRSGTRGTPWRLAIRKTTGVVEMLAFANFSRELTFGRGRAYEGKVLTQIVDYSTKPFSLDPRLRASLGKRLVAIGRVIEERFGSAQIIEGCVVGKDIFILQTRPQL